MGTISLSDSDFDGVMDDSTTAPTTQKAVTATKVVQHSASGDGEEGLFGVDAGTIMLAPVAGNLAHLTLFSSASCNEDDEDDEDDYDDFFDDDDEEESFLDQLDKAVRPAAHEPCRIGKHPLAHRGHPALRRLLPRTPCGPSKQGPGGPPKAVRRAKGERRQNARCQIVARTEESLQKSSAGGE